MPLFQLLLTLGAGTRVSVRLRFSIDTTLPVAKAPKLLLVFLYMWLFVASLDLPVTAVVEVTITGYHD